VVMCLTYFGGEINWMKKIQSAVALTNTKVEYMDANHARKEVVWLYILCTSIRLVQQVVRIYYDSHCAIFLEKNSAYHSKKNNIDVQYHFVRDMVEDKKVFLIKV
jgi:hypothetical protein